MEKNFICYECKKEWSVAYGTGRPLECPACRSSNIHRSPSDRGRARGRRFGGNPVCGRGNL
jgi:DNA-directed RNA polymerase subunit RPC12/RpoP